MSVFGCKKPPYTSEGLLQCCQQIRTAAERARVILSEFPVSYERAMALGVLERDLETLWIVRRMGEQPK
jgi:hypothetical protein